MSSIMKALKKLEQEKVQQDSEPARISREILRQQPDNRKLVLLLRLGGVAAFMIIAIQAFLLMSRTVRKNETIAAPPAEKRNTLPQGSLLPQKQQEPTTIIRKNEAAAVKQTTKPAATGAAPEPATRAKPARTEPVRTETPTVQPSQLEPAKIQPPTASPAEVQLTLSGIAWNKDSADRLAIINGQAMATGATVSGALVEEILPDRVRLSRRGKSFELLLGKTTRTD